MKDLADLLREPRLPTMAGAKFGYYFLASAALLGCCALLAGGFMVHPALGAALAPFMLVIALGVFPAARSQLHRLQRLRSLQRIS